MAKKRSDKSIDVTVAYQKTFGSLDGQTVLLDLMTNCHMLTSHRTKDAIDPYNMAFREGERNTILRIMAILKTDVQKLRKHIETQQREEDSYADSII